jgi:hypothetical protein
MRKLVFVVLFAVLALNLCADPRPFTFTYDLYPEGKGNIEYEQWATYQAHTDEDSDYQRITFRHEIEYGVTDYFDLSVYVANWYYQDSDAFTGTHYDSSSIEGIVYLSSPVTDPLGVALYMEVGIGEHELTLEPKLLLQKDIGNWTFAYNLVLETEIEHIFGKKEADEEVEVEGELAHAFGISYAFNPSWRLGGEVVVESVYADWSDYEGTTVYAGPAISYSGGSIGSLVSEWWIAATPAVQLTDQAGEPDFQLRMVVGFVF